MRTVFYTTFIGSFIVGLIGYCPGQEPDVKNPQVEMDELDTQAQLRAILKDFEDNPVESGMDRDEMLARVRHLLKKMRANRSTEGIADPSQGSAASAESPDSPHGNSAGKVGDKAVASGEPERETQVTVLQKPPISDPLVCPASAELPAGAELSAGSEVGDNRTDVVPGASETGDDLIARLDVRVAALEAELNTVNEKLAWLYRNVNQRPSTK